MQKFPYLVSSPEVSCCLETVAEIFSPLDNPTTNPVRTTRPSVKTVTVRSVGKAQNFYLRMFRGDDSIITPLIEKESFPKVLPCSSLKLVLLESKRAHTETWKEDASVSEKY